MSGEHWDVQRMEWDGYEEPGWRIKGMLDNGWEPFAATATVQSAQQHYLWLRRSRQEKTTTKEEE